MELAVHQAKITGLMRRVKANEADRASDAGSDREEIGQLLELTGLHKKAFGVIRSIDKMTDEKRQDCLRSLNALLELMDPVWNGQKTPDMFEDGVEPEHDDAIQTDDFEAELNEAAE